MDADAEVRVAFDGDTDLLMKLKTAAENVVVVGGAVAGFDDVADAVENVSLLVIDEDHKLYTGTMGTCWCVSEGDVFGAGGVVDAVTSIGAFSFGVGGVAVRDCVFCWGADGQDSHFEDDLGGAGCSDGHG